MAGASLNYAKHVDKIWEMVREGRSDPYIVRELGGSEKTLGQFRRANDIPAGISRRPGHKYMPWTKEEDARLLEMSKQGISVQDIAAALARKETGVYKRLDGLNQPRSKPVILPQYPHREFARLMGDLKYEDIDVNELPPSDSWIFRMPKPEASSHGQGQSMNYGART